jgi:hypothetical protein
MDFFFTLTLKVTLPIMTSFVSRSTNNDLCSVIIALTMGHTSSRYGILRGRGIVGPYGARRNYATVQYLLKFVDGSVVVVQILVVLRRFPSQVPAF